MITNFSKLLLFVILIANFVTARAQAPSWLWAETDSASVRSITIDAFGNRYETGWFSAPSITFDSITLINSGNSTEIFIVKYDAKDNILWARSISGSGDELVGENSISVDGQGNLFIAGVYRSLILNFGSVTLTKINNNSPYNIFVAKFDSSGNVIWARKVFGDALSQTVQVTALATDASGNVSLAGYIIGNTLVFDSISVITNGTQLFVAKYDSIGTIQWARSAGNNSSSYKIINSIADDSFGNIFIIGVYNSPSITFGSLTLTTAGGNDIFLIKYDRHGNVIWAKSFGNNGLDWGNSVATDGSGNVYIAGNFQSLNITFGSTILTNANTFSASSDAFIVKFDSSGNSLSAQGFGATDQDEGDYVTTDNSGNIYFGGYYSNSTITFGSTTLINTTNGSWEIFIVKFDSNFSPVWAKGISGTSNETLFSIAINKSNYDLFIRGRSNSSSLNFGPFIVYPGNSFFIAKLGFNAWRSCGAILQSADYAAGFVTGGYGYVGTGQDSSGTYLTSMHKFDPSGSGTWSTIASYSNVGRSRATGFSLNGNGYVGLGYDGNSYNDFLEYYITSDSWNTTSHALNYNNGGAPDRYYSVAFTIGNIAYVGLGTNGSGSIYDDFYSFDGINWIPVSPFPGGQRYAAVAFTIGDTAYVGTGMDGSGNVHQDFYAYDAVNGWHPAPINMGSGNERANAIAFTIGRFGFVGLGGHDNGINCTNDLWQFDPSMNTFTQKTSLPSTSLYNYAVGFSIGGMGYVCMGGNCDGTDPSNETWEYIPDLDVSGSVIGINKINNPTNISGIFPNPVIDHANVMVRLNSNSTNPGSIHFLATNLLGQPVLVENKINKNPDGNIIINIQREKLPSGFYLYKITNGNDLLSTGKFIAE